MYAKRAEDEVVDDAPVDLAMCGAVVKAEVEAVKRLRMMAVVFMMIWFCFWIIYLCVGLA
jgi:hypothetical protein